MTVKKKGVSYQPDVFAALEKYAFRNFDGNISKAQDVINRKYFRFVVIDPKEPQKQAVLF